MEQGRIISEFMMRQPEWEVYFDSLQFMKHKDLLTPQENYNQFMLQKRLGDIMTNRYYAQLEGDQVIRG